MSKPSNPRIVDVPAAPSSEGAPFAGAVTWVTFRETVRNPVEGSELTRCTTGGQHAARGEGFVVEPNESGVVCYHPSKPSAVFVPWSNVREMRFEREEVANG